MALPIAHLTGVHGFVELAPMLIAALLYAKRATTLAAGPERGIAEESGVSAG